LKNLIKKHAEKVRFGIVGIASTAIDFIILFTLVLFGLPALASNFISTSIAMVFSFFTNKSFTFKNDSAGKKHFVYFVIITLFGLWIIQPIIIVGVEWLSSPILTHNCITETLVNIFEPWFKPDYLVIFFAKCWATAASLIWNYLMYRRFVFREKQA
jgi:putative flippase GtrA